MMLLVKVLSDTSSCHNQFFNDSNDTKHSYLISNAQFSTIKYHYISITHTPYPILSNHAMLYIDKIQYG